MADALKAEGNKLFAAKSFDEAVYVRPQCPSTSPLADPELAVPNSAKQSSSNLKITFSTPTDQAPMRLLSNSTKRSKMPPRRPRSSPTGRKDGAERALLCTAQAI